MRTHTAALVLIALACQAHDSSESRGLHPVDTSSRQVSAAPESTPPPLSQPTELLRTLYNRLTDMGQDRAAVRSRLGEPRLTTTAAEPNAHDATAVDTVVQWTFEHLHFSFLVVAGSELLLETRAATDYPGVAPLISQFGTLRTAEATFGAPNWTAVLADTMLWGYNITEPGIGVSQNAVNLYFKNDRLIFVAAVPYVD